MNFKIKGKKSREAAYYILDRLVAQTSPEEAFAILKDLVVNGMFFEKSVKPGRRAKLIKQIVEDYCISDEFGNPVVVTLHQ